MRIRSIKPEFWISESVGRLSRDARLLFIGLWSFADDSGRGRGAFAAIAGSLLAYDSDAIQKLPMWFGELEQEGMVRRYVGEDGNTYFDIPNWSKHQRIERPSASKLPSFTEGSPKAHRTICEDSPQEQGAGNREREQGKEDPPPPSGESSDGQFHKIPSCEKKAGKFDPLSVELPACIPYEVWSDWVAYRKEKKKPLTETTVRLQLKKLATLSDPVAALTRSMANGWIGFDFDGGTPRTPPQPPEDDFSFEAAKAKAEQVGARMAAMMREGTL